MPITTPRLFLTGLTAAMVSFAPIGFGSLTSPLAISAAQAATATVDINIFFDQLAPHGVWVKHPKYHYVFCPKVDADWRPYTHGHWVYLKDWGWYFASSEPFAWAVYHYGRWFSDDRLGWCWVPGNAWAGAWVSWRRSNDYIGWAALEPDQDGYQVNVSISSKEPPQHDWVFVPPKRFLEPQLNVAIVLGDRQPDAFQKTQFVGPVVVQNNRVINNVIEVNFIQQVTNTTVVVVNPTIVNQPQQSADASGNTVAVFAPPIAPPKQDEAPKESKDPDQAAKDLGKPPAGASSAPSSAEVSASASAPASVAPSTEASSAAPSSTASSTPVSRAEASSSLPPSSASEAPSSAAPASTASSAAPAPAPSSAPPSSMLSSSDLPASSVAPAASSAEPASKESSKKLQVCPEGYIIVKGQCVLAPSSAAQ